MDTIKIPGPDHPITVEATPRRIQVLFEGHVIADSDNALTLRESSNKPVFYFPREDVAMEFFGRTDRVTHCPYKGHAHYYTISMDGHIAEHAVWTYEEPYPAMSVIENRVAFYPNQVEFHEVGETRPARSADDVVLHTDAGDGRSQAQHWPSNVESPLPLD